LGTYGRDAGAGIVASLEASARFEGAETRRYDWQQHYSRDEWLDQLPTHSDHRTLPAKTLQALLAAVGAAISGLGGSIHVHYDTLLVTARRLAV
jgi:hypothetical protein